MTVKELQGFLNNFERETIVYLRDPNFGGPFQELELRDFGTSEEGLLIAFPCVEGVD